MSSLITRSKSVPYANLFPITSNRVENLCKQDLSLIIEDHAKRTYPVVHCFLDILVEKFINITKSNSYYAEVYKTMNTKNFVDRCLKKRPLVFLGCNDFSILKNGKKVSGSFKTIGTNKEKYPLLLKNVISYDEMLFSAFYGFNSNYIH